MQKDPLFYEAEILDSIEKKGYPFCTDGRISKSDIPGLRWYRGSHHLGYDTKISSRTQRKTELDFYRAGLAEVENMVEELEKLI